MANQSFKSLKKYLSDDKSWTNTFFYGSTKQNCIKFLDLIDKCIKDDYSPDDKENKFFSKKVSEEIAYLNTLLCRGNFTPKEFKLLKSYCLLLHNMINLVGVSSEIYSLHLINNSLVEEDLSYSEIKNLINFYLGRHLRGDRNQSSSFFSTKYIEENLAKSKENE